jgi:aminoglycoside 6'-N-acetyltransferase
VTAGGPAPSTERDRDGPPLPVLRGRRVTLRPTTRRDILPLAAILADPEVARWWPRYDAARVRSELVARAGRPAWGIEVDGAAVGAGSGPALVGAIAASEEGDPDYRHAGIDLFLDPLARGRGLGPEAIALVAAWLVDERGHHRLTIDPAADNVAAVRAYRKVGFEPVGRLRRYERGPDGEWRDGVLLELLAADLVRDA